MVRQLSISNLKIVVTGGAGFIGYRLVSMLSKQNQVFVIDSFERSAVTYEELSKIAKCYKGNILDTSFITPILKNADVVIHLAAYGSVIESIEDPITNFKINVEGTLSVLIASKNSNVKKIIFSSTGGAIMGNTPPPVSELSLPSTISPFGASKLCCEGFIRAFSESYGINATIFRFANIYGRYSSHKKGAVTKFIKATLKGEDIEIFGDGSATRDFLHVDDLCKGLIQGIDSKKEGCEIYHLASNTETSVKELAELIISFNSKTKTNILYKPYRKGEVLKNFADAEKAFNELGYKPSISFHDGMLDTYNWFSEMAKD